LDRTGLPIFGVFVVSSLFSYVCGFELFILIPRLDLGVVIIVVACDCFDCGYYFSLLHTSLFIGVSFEPEFTQ